jgi:hypothetical protein
MVIDCNAHVVYTVTDMTTTMEIKTLGIKPYLAAKRAELIWALAQQNYSDADIGNIFNVSKQRVLVIRKQMPDGWVSPWIKVK